MNINHLRNFETKNKEINNELEHVLNDNDITPYSAPINYGTINDNDANMIAKNLDSKFSNNSLNITPQTYIWSLIHV